MGFLDSVSREQYEAMKQSADEWRTRYDALFAAYEKLRPTHAPVAPIRVTPPREEAGPRELHAIEAAIRDPAVAKAADALMQQKPGLSRTEAMVEAKRLTDIARGRATAPTVSGSEPPVR